MAKLCKCGKENNPKFPERHTDGTLKTGTLLNTTGRRGSPGSRGNQSVRLLDVMKKRWNRRPTASHYRAAAMELNRGLTANDVDWINPIDLEHNTVGELVLFIREIHMCRGADSPFKTFADRVAPMPARDLNVNLGGGPAPEADTPEGRAAYGWFERLRPQEGETKH